MKIQKVTEGAACLRFTYFLAESKKKLAGWAISRVNKTGGSKKIGRKRSRRFS
jgi:hypothetical protein